MVCLAEMIKTILFFSFLTITVKAAVPDCHFVAATMVLEAGGERDIRSLLAIYEVIRNRAESKKLSLKSVVLKKHAFSCWTGQTIQNNLNKAKKSKKWAEALKIVQNNRKTNYTFGANHYYAIYIKKPKWAEKMKQTAIIQNHIFLKQ